MCHISISTVRKNLKSSYASYLCDVSPWQWKVPAIRHFWLSSHQTPKSARCGCQSHSRTKKHDITAVLISLHWLPIKQHIQYKLLLLMLCSLHGLVIQPTYRFDTSLNWSSPATGSTMHAMYSGDKTLPQKQPAANLACHRHSSFKKQLKTYLLKKVFSLWTNIYTIWTF